MGTKGVRNARNGIVYRKQQGGRLKRLEAGIPGPWGRQCLESAMNRDVVMASLLPSPAERASSHVYASRLFLALI